MLETSKAVEPVDKALKSELWETEQKIHHMNNAIAQGIYSSSTSTVKMLKELEERQAGLYLQLADLEKTKVNTSDTYEEFTVEKVICYENEKIRIVFNPLGLNNTDLIVFGGQTRCNRSALVKSANPRTI